MSLEETSAAAANLAGAGALASPPPPSPSTHLDVAVEGSSSGCNQRSLSLTSERAQLSRELQCIAEDPDDPNASSKAAEQMVKGGKPLTAAQQKRATMVKKAIKYFEDKSNRSVSEDNLFTRRKNLAVHLGLDEKVSKKEVQKINTFSLPVPSSATSFDLPDPVCAPNLVVIEDDDEDVRSKNLVHFLGMKDGLTASIASQGSLCESPRGPTSPNVAAALAAAKASPAYKMAAAAKDTSSSSSSTSGGRDQLFKF